jgi:hypothetical protein
VADHRGFVSSFPSSATCSAPCLIAQAEFTFYPGAAGWSTMYPDHAEVEKAVQAYVEEALPLLKGLQRNPLTLLGQAIARTDNAAAKRFIRVRNTSLMLGEREQRGFGFDTWRCGQTTTKRSVDRMLGTAQTVQCQLMSVSQIMAQQQLPVVDLLKVRSRGCTAMVVVSQGPGHPQACCPV